MLEALGLDGTDLRERPRQRMYSAKWRRLSSVPRNPSEGKEEEDAQRRFQKLPENVSRGEGGSPAPRNLLTT